MAETKLKLFLEALDETHISERLLMGKDDLTCLVCVRPFDLSNLMAAVSDLLDKNEEDGLFKWISDALQQRKNREDVYPVRTKCGHIVCEEASYVSGFKSSSVAVRSSILP